MLTKAQRIQVLEAIHYKPTRENLLIVERTETAIQDNLASLIEGMEVSIDVSTCPEGTDADKRLFGIVNECMDHGSKNGMILLVYETKSNYDLEHERTRFEQHVAADLESKSPTIKPENMFTRLKDGSYEIDSLNAMWWAWRTSIGCKDLP